MKLKWVGAVIFVIIVAIIVAEVSERLLGFTAYPIYIREASDGYRPAPNQHGQFLNRNDWVFNDRGMGVAAPYKPEGMLLEGDSEVEGGVSFLKQADRVGPLLQQCLGRTVWPLGARNWGLANELGFITSHPEYYALPTIAILSNSGDFGPAHPWDDQANHPTYRPLIATFAMIKRKSGHADPLIDDPPPTSASTKIWRDLLHRYFTSYRGHIIFILLPTAREAASHTDGFGPLLSEMAAERRPDVTVIRVGDDPNWSSTLYQSNFHPAAKGNRELAAYVCPRLAALK